jgi:hypothetical protein
MAAPALAQRPAPANSGDRGAAVERGGGSSGNVGSGASGVASSAAGSASSPSAVSAATPSMGFGSSARAAYRESAPQRRVSSGSSSSGQAVPRGSSGGSATSGSSSGTRSATPARQGSSTNREGGSQAVPNWARPRGDRPANDNAVQRTTPRPDRRGVYTGRYYDPYGYYYGSPYYNGFYGSYYSPFFSPYMLGYGFGLGFPLVYDPMFGGDDWYGGSGYGGGTYSQGTRDEDQGSLRLKIKPRDAKVYVDNYFVGTVDSMDGVFQKLPLNGGRHRVTIKADGYEPEEFDVMITPSETATYEGDLKKIR